MARAARSLTRPASPARRAAPRAKPLRTLGPYLFLVPALLFVALTMLYPVYSNVRMSLHDVNIGTFLSGDQPFVGVENYRTLVADAGFRKAVRLSATFTAASIFFQFMIGFALALFFSRPFPGNGLLRALLLLAWMLPTVVSGSLFRWQLDGDFGVINFALERLGLLETSRYWLIEPGTALAGTIIANIWVGVPFNMVLLLAGLQNIPHDLYEAASIDGAGGWQRFRAITLPLMRPVALSVLLLGLIYTFKVFDLIYVMTGGGPVDASTVLPIYAYQLTFQFFRFGQGAAAATILLVALLPVAALYLWASRREEVRS